jgi:uncharacterized protein (TIGR02996 family)
MSDDAEHELLAAIARHDEASRLVYADFLEARGEVARAEFLRLQQVLVGTPPTDAAGKRLWKSRSKRLRELAEHVGEEWRIAVARPLVENCDAHFDFACPMEWGQLTETAEPDVRACNLCDELVYYSTSIAAARRHAAMNRCVAVDITVERRPDDLVQIQTRGRMVLVRVDDDK